MEISQEQLESLGIDLSNIGICRKIRNMAKLDRIKLDENTHRSGLNKHLFDYLDYCGLDKLEWDKVKDVIEDVFENTNIEILICIL